MPDHATALTHRGGGGNDRYEIGDNETQLAHKKKSEAEQKKVGSTAVQGKGTYNAVHASINT